MKSVVVIGGGAAGMMSAIQASNNGCSVTLIERNEKVGRKLYITGKGRCNVTNNCQPSEALKNYPRGGKFLSSAMNRFTPSDVMEFFENEGVALKTERGNRVFPVSDKASDIIDALYFTIKRKRIKIITARVADLILDDNKITGVELQNKQVVACDAVILATGGMSYPATGSSGDGYKLAEKIGHTIIEPKASLIPLVVDGDECQQMMGLSLKNIRLRVKSHLKNSTQKSKTVFDEFGEMLFTHFGISGPLVLSASAHLSDYEKFDYTAVIDLKPALDERQLDNRILRDFADNPNQTFKNILSGLLPRLIIPVVINRLNISPEIKVHDITKQQRHSLIEAIKGFNLTIAGTRPVSEAIITSGGIKLSEVNPKTMQSKKTENLYFAGEILDIDGYTGGFNLQAAWCTGFVAGNSV